MTIMILDHELLVGNLASSPRGVPLFPEFSVNWLIEELDGNPVRPPDRPGDSFDISAEDEKKVRELTEYWNCLLYTSSCV